MVRAVGMSELYLPPDHPDFLPPEDLLAEAAVTHRILEQNIQSIILYTPDV